MKRFIDKVIPEPTSGCWLWTAAVSSAGYGNFFYEGKVCSAHRVSFELFCHEIEEEMNVLHKCDVRCCVNPDHLFLGDDRDNMQDMLNKGRGNKPIGERSSTALLTKDDVLEIRKSTSSSFVLSEMYGVHHSTIRDIRLRRSWKHI